MGTYSPQYSAFDASYVLKKAFEDDFCTYYWSFISNDAKAFVEQQIQEFEQKAIHNKNESFSLIVFSIVCAFAAPLFISLGEGKLLEKSFHQFCQYCHLAAHTGYSCGNHKSYGVLLAEFCNRLARLQHVKSTVISHNSI